MEGSVSRRMLTLRYPAACSLCSGALPRGAEAWWNRETKQATCLLCGSGTEFARELAGTAGGSGRAKYERLHERREKKVKGALGEKLGGVYLFLKDEPQSTRAWRTGSAGEQRLARFFEQELTSSAIALHDRRIPGSRANIDHIVVAPSGVWVIDAKLYSGRVERRTVGLIWGSEAKVFVGGRDRTKLVHGMASQVEATRGALSPDPLADDVAVIPALCFVASEWGLLAKPFELSGVIVTWAQKLVDRIAAPGALTATAVARLANRIAVALPPAVREKTSS